MPTIKTVNDLRVYQHSLKLYSEVLKFLSQIPPYFYKQKRQINNSAMGIPPLIAEGYAKRRNSKETTRFFEMAMAESDELQTHFQMLKDLVKFSTGSNKNKCDYFINEYQILSKELNSLRYNWDKFHYHTK